VWLLADAVCPVAAQFEANVAIRIRAQIGRVTVVGHVRVAARGDVVALRGRQGARNSGKNNSEPKRGFGEHRIFLLDLTEQFGQYALVNRNQ
jgi:hypothetical protein